IIQVEMLKRSYDEASGVYTVKRFDVPILEHFPTKWYEVSLVSPIAQQILGENEALEFGEQPSWTEENFEERVQVFESMCRPACYMVKEMDGMGFYNDNGLDIGLATPGSSAMSSTASNTTYMAVPQLPPRDPLQW